MFLLFAISKMMYLNVSHLSNHGFCCFSLGDVRTGRCNSARQSAV